MRRFRGCVALMAVMACCLACASSQKAQEEAAPPLPEPAGGWKLIPPADVAGLGNFENSARLAINGKFVRNQTLWNAAGCVWWNGVQSQIVVDLGKPCTVAGVVVQLASDNDYEIRSSVDGFSYRFLCEIKRGDFKLRWGMDTVSSLPGRTDSVPAMAFKPVTARYLKLLALGGVNQQYAVSEIQAYGACGGTPGS